MDRERFGERPRIIGLRRKFEELQESADDLAHLLDSTDVATLFLDRELRVRRYTPALGRLIDLSRLEAGRTLEELLDELPDRCLLGDARRVLAEATPIEREIEDESGRSYQRWVVPYRTRAQGVDGVVVTFTDITSLKSVQEELARINEDLEEEVARRTGHLGLLLDIAAIANRARDPREALGAALGRICRGGGWEVGHAYLVDGEGRAIPTGVWHVHAEGWEVEELRRRLGGVTIAPGQGLVGAVLATGEPRWSTDLPASRTFDRSGGAAELGLRTGLFFPILVGDRVAGVLEFFSTAVRPPRPKLSEVMAHVGMHLGRVLERHRMERQLDELAVREQVRIAAELHDTVGQHLAGVGMAASQLARALSESDSQHAPLAAALVERLEEGHDQLRSLSRVLSGGWVDAGGLPEGIEQLYEHYRRLHPADYRLEIDPVGGELDERLSTNLYRIAREAVHNAVRHGRPGSIGVRLSVSNGVAMLEVEDDGGGMEVVPWNEKGIGLSIMSQAAELIGGRLEIDSRPGEGTRVRCRLPELEEARSRRVHPRATALPGGAA